MVRLVRSRCLLPLLRRAIFVRTALLTSGALSFPDGPPVGEQDGRLISAPVQWCGRRFFLVCAYLPSSDPPGQRVFIQSRLAALAARPGMHVWAGDFNFVVDPALDSTSGDGRGADVLTAAAFAASCPEMHDAFRTLHPSRRSFTFFSGGHASRLDRIMVSAPDLAVVQSCAVRPAAPSDHKMVVLRLAPGSAARRTGPGLPRARLHFLDCPGLREEMLAWLEQSAGGAPETPAALLAWWPSFKSALVARTNQLSRVARDRVIRAAYAEVDALQEAAAAFAEVEQGVPGAAARAASARSRAAVAAVQASQPLVRRTRHTWLRTGERPSPVVTSLVRPPAACRHIAALRRPDGSLSSDPAVMAQTVADYWRTVGTQQPPDPVAREAVLDALRAAARRCPPGAVAGAMTVS